jgi:hypothetical protein
MINLWKHSNQQNIENTMETTLANIPCTIEVTSYTPYHPARLDGAMEDAEEACGGEIEFKAYINGCRAEWLEDEITKSDVDRIFDEYEATLTEEF